MNSALKLPPDVLKFIRRAKKELPGEFVAYPLDSGLTIEEFRENLIKRLKEKSESNSKEKLT